MLSSYPGSPSTEQARASNAALEYLAPSELEIRQKKLEKYICTFNLCTK